MASTSSTLPAAPFPETLPRPPSQDWTFADVQELLGGVPADRIRTYPAPGTATEEDLLEVRRRTGRICELVEGILVEKPMGVYESRLAVVLIHFIETFLDVHKLGIALGESAFLKLRPDLTRAPDVSFIAWDRFPDRRLSHAPVWTVAPDLAVEILSPSNTEKEMQRKLREYFETGVRLVWYVEPELRTAKVYTSPDRFTVVRTEEVLDGRDVLPGFQLRLKDWFTRAEEG